MTMIDRAKLLAAHKTVTKPNELPQSILLLADALDELERRINDLPEEMRVQELAEIQRASEIIDKPGPDE
jgi:hypothetical protein